MPVLFTYDVSSFRPDPVHNSRLQSMLDRFGWQKLGGSAYRYPSFERNHAFEEDWFNSVIPALMLFRAYVLKHNLSIGGFALEAHSSTGYDNRGNGDVPDPAPVWKEPGNTSFGLESLKKWLDATSGSVPY